VPLFKPPVLALMLAVVLLAPLLTFHRLPYTPAFASFGLQQSLIHCWML
jgi:hypothetical protein